EQQLVPAWLDADGAHQREQPMNLVAPFRPDQCGGQRARIVLRAHEPGARRRAEHEREGVRVYAGTVQLYRQIKALRLHALEKFQRMARLEELLRDAEETRKGDEAIDVRGAHHQVA